MDRYTRYTLDRCLELDANNCWNFVKSLDGILSFYSLPGVIILFGLMAILMWISIRDR